MAKDLSHQVLMSAPPGDLDTMIFRRYIDRGFQESFKTIRLQTLTAHNW